MAIPTMSDTINLSDVHAGNANAGNGGDGYNDGTINYNPSAYVENTQAVTGSDVDLHNGDHLWQTADWGAGTAGHGGGAEAENGFLSSITNNGSGGAGGSANSNGNQGALSGGDVAAVHADTSATQNTQLFADQHANILAGVGGNGGNGNMARGGDVSTALVHSDPSTTTTNFTSSIDHSFVDIDLSHLPV
ncbi:MAG: PE-PGRS family protein [Rhizobiaceae bacterium]